MSDLRMPFSQPATWARIVLVHIICIFLLITVLSRITSATVEIPFQGAIYSVHRPNGSLKTYLEIVIDHEFRGKLPDEIDSIDITGPSGALKITKDDFHYNHQWRSFWTVLEGPPETGKYEFRIKSRNLSGKDSDIQLVTKAIPLPDVDRFYPSTTVIKTCPTMSFTWPLVSANFPLYYMFEVNKGPHNIFRTGYVKDMNLVRIPENLLEPGVEYRWRVRIADSPSWSTINNRSQSRWLKITLLPNLDSCSYTYDSPISSDDGLNVSTLQNEGIDEETVKTLITKILNEEILNIHSLLIVKNGRLVLEEYFAGYARNALHSVASVTKSITSILIGIALDKQIIASVDSSIYDLLPSYHGRHWSASHRAIRLEHVLTMTAGLDWNDWVFPDGDMRDSTTAMSKSDDWIRFTLERATVEPPGKTFVYNNGLSLILGEIIKGSTGHHADIFAEQYLFNPLNIKNYQWKKGKNNIVETAGGLAMRPRDMAKIGLLMINAGKWQERQIVSADWVCESTKMHLREHILFGGGYGYHWWRGELFIDNKKIDLFYAAGRGGQYIFVCPKLDLVTVITSEVGDNSMGEFLPQIIMANYIIPSVVTDLPSDTTIEYDPANKGRYVGDYYSSTYDLTVTLTQKEDKLFYIESDNQKGEMHFISESQCFAETEELGKIRANFFFNDSREVTHLMLQVGFGFWQFDKIN